MQAPESKDSQGPEQLEDERIVLDVWLADYPFPTYDGRDFLAPLRERAAEFERAHPEYRIDITGHDFWTMPGLVAQAAGEGRAPHVAGYYTTDSQLARDARRADGTPLFTSVGAALAGRSEILGEPVVVDDLDATVRDSYSFDGELVSLPLTVTTMLCYANTTLLRRAGVTELPRTWDEVVGACEALAGTEDAPGHGITWANDGWVFQQAIALQNGLLADRDNGRSGPARTVDIASEQMLDWVRWWALLQEDGHYLYTGGTSDWGGAFEAFVQQRVAFTFDSSKAARELIQAGAQSGFEVAVFPLPRNAHAPYAGQPVSGDSLWLAAGLDKATEDGALALMQYLIGPANAADWHRTNGFVPVTGAALDLLERSGWFDRRPQQRVAGEQLKASDRSPAALGALLGDFAGINDVITGAMDEILSKGAEPVKTFGDAAVKAQRLLDAYTRAQAAVASTA
ncbi:extracellular solute-binding protein [Streptomyces sp. SM11]|uniref:extracellular solute-binding protein n=1 Tax=Streptomyces sp. SM11 TaxID=565557 RepID=UPI0015E1A87D|nr:extracellular solute-binding protein [Streptomyces sp. SM11]